MQFANDFLAGKIAPFVKSQPVPAPSSKTAVKTVVATTFTKEVYEADADVLIEFFAPCTCNYVHACVLLRCHDIVVFRCGARYLIVWLSVLILCVAVLISWLALCVIMLHIGCEHCKQLAPVWEDLARTMKNVPGA